MPRIASVSFAVCRVPLDKVTSFSTRTVSAREYCLVKVTSDDGIEGIGFCYGGHRAARIVAVAVEDLLAPLLIGEESLEVERLWETMYRAALLHGRAGSVMRAISILDNALWDLNARSVGLPLHHYLGSAANGSVAAYASGGYYVEGKTNEDLATELAGYVADGFDAVKVKVGQGDPRAEGERLRIAREAIGPDVLLMLDANNAWDDLPTALAYMREFEPSNPYWIEEPFSPDDIDNHARLATLTPVPVATGEIEAGRWRFKELMEKEAAQILQVDACVCGGISEFRRIAATAASYGLTLSPHWFHDLHVHLVAAFPNARYVEFFPDDQVLNFRRLVGTQLECRKGRLALPTQPGIGFDFDEQAVRKYDGVWAKAGV
ncbi:MAG TPA: mandelate racemase/muconate lactonizing enzyme family protein [Rhizobiaceae bacterium]|nr:mandelate racemase/muconate lactonizing enzyme family protein [Rhizobiaceae bacterium]